MKYTYNCVREKKRKNIKPNVKIVPVFWKSPDELSKRLSLPVCQGEGEKAKRKKLQNLICYEIASHKKKSQVQNTRSKGIRNKSFKHETDFATLVYLWDILYSVCESFLCQSMEIFSLMKYFSNLGIQIYVGYNTTSLAKQGLKCIFTSLAFASTL